MNDMISRSRAVLSVLKAADAVNYHRDAANSFQELVAQAETFTRALNKTGNINKLDSRA